MRPKAKIRREIVSKAMGQAISRWERHRAETQQQLQDEIRKRESLIAPDGAADVTSKEQQKERYLLREEFVRKLQKLNPNLIYERSKQWPEFGGLYIQDWYADSDMPIASTKWFLCGIPHEVVAEFDVRVVLNDRVPDPTVPLHWIEVPQLEENIPGWRSTIKKLVNRGIINLTAAEVEFEIPKGRSSQRWHDAIN